MRIKDYIKSHAWANSVIAWIYRFISYNKIVDEGYNNTVSLNVSGLFLSKSRIRIKGSGNSIIFLPNELGAVSHFVDLRIDIQGNNNRIVIGSHSSGIGLRLCMENDNNQILLGEHFTVGPNTELAVIEGTSIEFGNDCQLSANITLRTGDSHSITDLRGRRTNPSKSIKIGNHVWIGNTVLVFKGTRVGDNSIIAGGAVVGGKTFPEHCIIGGNPAKVIKEDVNWDRNRLPIL